MENANENLLSLSRLKIRLLVKGVRQTLGTILKPKLEKPNVPAITTCLIMNATIVRRIDPPAHLRHSVHHVQQDIFLLQTIHVSNVMYFV